MDMLQSSSDDMITRKLILDVHVSDNGNDISMAQWCQKKTRIKGNCMDYDICPPVPKAYQ